MSEVRPSLEEILKDPSAVFDSPHDVVDDTHLSDEDKSEILKTWKEDAKALIRAESENMESAKRTSPAPELLTEISNIQIEFEEARENNNDS
ncbi:hypothetical protein [uncultured Sneathiella sp.]|jgi:hypothetical protein|uniref:hypothetical protein n=1 Tax=uncultured Sneathiella sp. TaxID=879315 RepID=UPI0030DB59F6|tara:strand:+ start:1235 stop:1510 length:276 start_codon:yes stop_codon:yes gene_type:complete